MLLSEFLPSDHVRLPLQATDKTGLLRELSEFLAEKDGGPYISAGVVMARSPERGLNAGVYRLMYRCRDETGIDLVTVSDLRRLYERCGYREVARRPMVKERWQHPGTHYVLLAKPFTA